MTTTPPVAAMLEDRVNRYVAANEDLALTAAAAVAVIVLHHFPTAAYLLIDETDQDHTGTLIACSVADSAGNIISDDMFHASDFLVGGDMMLDHVLGMLNEANHTAWGQFEENSLHPHLAESRRLVLAKMLAAS